MIPIWEKEIPYFQAEYRQFPPSLTEFLLPGENNPCCVIFPGGGYVKKAWDHEGIEVAEWLNKAGMSAFVADYRIAPYNGDAILADGLQAIRFVREHAKEFGIDPHRIGVCGFSAGGHLAGCCATAYTGAEDRPDFAILGYAVLTLMERSHAASVRTFSGEHINDEDYKRKYTPIYQVTENCPPMFLWTTETDKTVPPQNTLAMHEACKKAGIPTRLEYYDHGSHGLGIPRNDPEIASWTKSCEEWMKELKIL